jgi:hypothetical protein
MINISNWLWPQWAMFLAAATAISLAGFVHGKDAGKFNGFIVIFRNAIVLAILAMGGFFK